MAMLNNQRVVWNESVKGGTVCASQHIGCMFYRLEDRCNASKGQPLWLHFETALVICHPNKYPRNMITYQKSPT